MEKNIKETTKLRDHYGSEITLYDEEDNEVVFHLLIELLSDGKHYAYLQEPNAEEGDIEVLEVVEKDGKYDLEFIEDDDEWENAAELFDEWTLAEE